jgi:hypothetical protein
MPQCFIGCQMRWIVRIKVSDNSDARSGHKQELTLD